MPAAGAAEGHGDVAARVRAQPRQPGIEEAADLFGASPSNLAAKIARLGTPVRRVSGLNLPMLLRVMNYSELPLDELPAIAAAGARNGVIHDDG
jgi:PTS system ascorbate-specific IIA component